MLNRARRETQRVQFPMRWARVRFGARILLLIGPVWMTGPILRSLVVKLRVTLLREEWGEIRVHRVPPLRRWVDLTDRSTDPVLQLLRGSPTRRMHLHLV